jgi:excisionase family DNA binding protein
LELKVSVSHERQERKQGGCMSPYRRKQKKCSRSLTRMKDQRNPEVENQTEKGILKAEVVFTRALTKEIASKVVEGLSKRETCEEEVFMTATEAAAMLRVSKVQIYQLVYRSHHRAGDFPYMKVERSLRFSRKDLTEWCKRNGRTLESS